MKITLSNHEFVKLHTIVATSKDGDVIRLYNKLVQNQLSGFKTVRTRENFTIEIDSEVSDLTMTLVMIYAPQLSEMLSIVKSGKATTPTNMMRIASLSKFIISDYKKRF